MDADVLDGLRNRLVLRNSKVGSYLIVPCEVVVLVLVCLGCGWRATIDNEGDGSIIVGEAGSIGMGLLDGESLVGTDDSLLLGYGAAILIIGNSYTIGASTEGCLVGNLSARGYETLTSARPALRIVAIATSDGY